MAHVGVVRFFDAGQGWGVIDGEGLPGGCWVHFSALALPGFRQLTAGQQVCLRVEAAEQDGFAFRAVRVWIGDEEPADLPSDTPGSSAYSSHLTLHKDLAETKHFTSASALRYKVWVTDVDVVLSEVEQLRQRVRSRAHGGAWVPALAIGSFLACSILLYTRPFVGFGYVKYVEFPYWAGLPDEQRSPILSYLFWYLGLPALVGLIGWWYRWRSRKLGLRVAWKWFAIVAIGSLVLLGLLSALPTSAVPVGAPSAVELDRNFDWVTGFATPLIAVALGVIMLGWVERSGWLIFAGLWIGWLTWWQSAYLTYGGLGGLPEWAGGPGVVTLLGVDTPGWLLVWMALPLMAFGVIRGLKARR